MHSLSSTWMFLHRKLHLNLNIFDKNSLEKPVKWQETVQKFDVLTFRIGFGCLHVLPISKLLNKCSQIWDVVRNNDFRMWDPTISRIIGIFNQQRSGRNKLSCSIKQCLKQSVSLHTMKCICVILSQTSRIQFKMQIIWQEKFCRRLGTVCVLRLFNLFDDVLLTHTISASNSQLII